MDDKFGEISTQLSSIIRQSDQSDKGKFVAVAQVRVFCNTVYMSWAEKHSLCGRKRCLDHHVDLYFIHVQYNCGKVLKERMHYKKLTSALEYIEPVHTGALEYMEQMLDFSVFSCKLKWANLQSKEESSFDNLIAIQF